LKHGEHSRQAKEQAVTTIRENPCLAVCSVHINDRPHIQGIKTWNLKRLSVRKPAASFIIVVCSTSIIFSPEWTWKASIYLGLVTIDISGLQWDLELMKSGWHDCGKSDIFRALRNNGWEVGQVICLVLVLHRSCLTAKHPDCL
jgi:hypothetical protein